MNWLCTVRATIAANLLLTTVSGARKAHILLYRFYIDIHRTSLSRVI